MTKQIKKCLVKFGEHIVAPVFSTVTDVNVVFFSSNNKSHGAISQFKTVELTFCAPDSDFTESQKIPPLHLQTDISAMEVLGAVHPDGPCWI